MLNLLRKIFKKHVGTTYKVGNRYIPYYNHYFDSYAEADEFCRSFWEIGVVMTIEAIAKYKWRWEK